MPANSSFDADAFMQRTVDQPLETDYKMCPVGEYPATIDDFTSEAIQQFNFDYKQGPRAGQPGVMTKFNCPFVINDPAIAQQLGRDKVVVEKQITLDLGPDGGLDWGVNKNVELGRLRQAAGQNQPGPWQIGKLKGVSGLMVKVEHTQFTRKDGTKGERAEVTRVTRIGS